MLQNNPDLKLAFQNPQLFLAPHIMQKEQNIFRKDEKSKIESSSIGISVPPDPFENNKMLNSTGKK